MTMRWAKNVARWGNMRNVWRGFFRKLKDHLKDLGIDERIIVKRINEIGH